MSRNITALVGAPAVAAACFSPDYRCVCGDRLIEAAAVIAQTRTFGLTARASNNGQSLRAIFLVAPSPIGHFG